MPAVARKVNIVDGQIILPPAISAAIKKWKQASVVVEGSRLVITELK